MATADRSADSVTFKTAQARVRDGNVAALSAIQQATSGTAGALKVTSDNGDVAAATITGAGDLLNLQDSSGVSQFSVTQAGAVTSSGDQTITGDTTITGTFTVNGATVLNEAGAAVDTRIEGDTDANLLFVDASTDRVGIGTATPGTKLEVTGVATVTQGAVINESGADSDTRIEGDTEVNLLFADASTDRVGIGTATPSERLDVVGGNVSITTAGNGLHVAEGSNARMGTATLVGGTVTVANTSVTANTRIFVSRSTTGGTEGHLSTTQIAATSFTVNSSSGTDTSTVNWLLIEPA